MVPKSRFPCGGAPTQGLDAAARQPCNMAARFARPRLYQETAYCPLLLSFGRLSGLLLLALPPRDKLGFGLLALFLGQHGVRTRGRHVVDSRVGRWLSRPFRSTGRQPAHLGRQVGDRGRTGAEARRQRKREKRRKSCLRTCSDEFG